ncbi:MAG: DMT family transporter [Sulfuritalea sp.]|nr:DMT family transporter [Sulfuritalea sp.]MBK9349535.1 DMT family transporter [Sulfuritalea sp.]
MHRGVVTIQTWFLLALISPLLWATCNHIDKIMLERYFKEGGVGTLLLVSALASVIAAPFLYVVDPSVLDVGIGNFGIIVVNSMLDILLLWAYLNAMQRDDSSRVIVYYQLVPIFGIVAGWIFLGEVISKDQFVAMAVVILGTSIVSLENVEGRFRFKGRTVGYMLLACACWAAELAIFKVVALEENPWRSLFWNHIVLMVLGVLMYLFIPRYRASFQAAMQTNSVPLLSANLLSEVLYMLAVVSYSLAAMLAPVALVLLTVTFQSIFVFLIAILIARFIPKLATESADRTHVALKGAAICITGLGTYLLLVAR